MTDVTHFNSRPSARGDCARPPEIRRQPNFNSRPSARGDGDTRAVLVQVNHISIHAPPRGATR